MTTRGAIWVWGDLRSRRLFDDSLKVLAKARPLAQAAGRPLRMIVCGALAQPPGTEGCAPLNLNEAAQEAAAQGAAAVLALNHPALAVPRTDVYARLLADLAAQRRPWLVLMALNDFNRETAAFCAQRCRAGMIADCAELVLAQERIIAGCPAWGGQIMADITLAEGWPMAFITVQPHGAPPLVPDAGGQVEMVTLPDVPVPANPQLLSRAKAPSDQRRLEEARKVVVGGAGLGDIRSFGLVRELAGALGAEVGATRPPVLLHWIAEERLIGQTGKHVHPELLISAGTSGAIQYTAGIMAAGTIVAVDRNPKAPIFEWADFGIVADAKSFLPLLTQRVQQITMRRLTDAACDLNATAAPAKGGFGVLVRQLRTARDWSVAELAQRTGQTPDFIVQVEEERIVPPVAFILGMAQAMQVDPGTFLRREERNAIRDRREAAYYRRTNEYSYTTLTPDAQNSHLRAFLVTIEPLRAHKPVAYKHEGEEFIYVLEGDLEFTLGTKAHILKPGESIHFNSDLPHKLKNLSNMPTRCLVVLYTI